MYVKDETHDRHEQCRGDEDRADAGEKWNLEPDRVEDEIGPEELRWKRGQSTLEVPEHPEVVPGVTVARVPVLDLMIDGNRASQRTG